MDLSPKDYQKYVKEREEKSPIFKDVIMAFLIGVLLLKLKKTGESHEN